jgi:hypothetical protein
VSAYWRWGVLAFGVWRLAFGVWRSAFGCAVRTSVTPMGQDIGNTVALFVACQLGKQRSGPYAKRPPFALFGAGGSAQNREEFACIVWSEHVGVPAKAT